MLFRHDSKRMEDYGYVLGTAVGLGLTAWTLFDIYHILKDVHGESKTLLDEGGVSTYLTGSKRANLIAEAQGLTGSRKIR